MDNGHWTLDTTMNNGNKNGQETYNVQCLTMDLNVLEHSSTFTANVEYHFIIYGVQGVPPRTGH